MTNPRELILEAFKVTLAGLETTGANVFRARPAGDDWLQQIELPALLINQGADVREVDNTTDVRQVVLINVDAVDVANADPVETVLNQIEVEVTAALLAAEAPWLGLEFVTYLWHAQTDDPVVAGTGDKSAGVMRMIWAVRYERDRTNPTA